MIVTLLTMALIMRPPIGPTDGWWVKYFALSLQQQLKLTIRKDDKTAITTAIRGRSRGRDMKAMRGKVKWGGRSVACAWCAWAARHCALNGSKVAVAVAAWRAPSSLMRHTEKEGVEELNRDEKEEREGETEREGVHCNF